MQRRAWDLVTRQNTSASLGRRKPITHLGDVHIEVHSARDATLFCLPLLACLATAVICDLHLYHTLWVEVDAKR
jgi:hypothetical protein